MPRNLKRAERESTPDRLLADHQDPFAPAAIKTLAKQFGTPLLVVDTERVRRQYHALALALPGVELHYALKPLPHAAVVATLRDAGAWFDLATTGEIELVRRLGIGPERCIHTHPIKRDIDIRNALHFGVSTFVVDNPDELHKFIRYRHRCALLIRVCFRSADAVCDLSRKFGCEPRKVGELLALAARLELKVAGFSFHVGSQTMDPGKYVEAIDFCAEFFGPGSGFEVLDIGGGFPVAYADPVPDIDAFCAPIRRALSRLAPSVRVIAEPGRFIAAPSAICVCQVIGRAERDGRWWYYLDDGLYGCFSGQMFDRARYPVDVLDAGGELLPSVLAGPTCDGIDLVDDDLSLPMLEIGSLIVGRVMGAYTWASASEFNFFPKPTIIALDHGRWLAADAVTGAHR